MALQSAINCFNALGFAASLVEEHPKMGHQPFHDSTSGTKVIISLKLPKTFFVYLLYNFNINLRLELPHIEKVCEGEVHVLKEIMELADQMQVLCQFLIQPLIPIRKWAVHSNERIKGAIFISWKRQSQHRYSIPIHRI